MPLLSDLGLSALLASFLKALCSISRLLHHSYVVSHSPLQIPGTIPKLVFAISCTSLIKTLSDSFSSIQISHAAL